MDSHNKAVPQEALDTLFFEARTYKGWSKQEVPDAMLRQIYDAMKWAPTATNSCPLRVKFVRTPEGKEKLKPFLDKNNVAKTMAAPVVAIFAHDCQFYNQFGTLAPHIDVAKWYEGKDEANAEAAFRNGSLQAAYFMLAARAFGLDCGPMSGFNKEGVKDAFFPDLHGDVNFLCNLGYGDPTSLKPRAARLGFDEVCEIV